MRLAKEKGNVDERKMKVYGGAEGVERFRGKGGFAL